MPLNTIRPTDGSVVFPAVVTPPATIAPADDATSSSASSSIGKGLWLLLVGAGALLVLAAKVDPRRR